VASSALYPTSIQEIEAEVATFTARGPEGRAANFGSVRSWIIPVLYFLALVVVIYLLDRFTCVFGAVYSSGRCR
jgi:hypothetical protein